ncbi:aspartate kinase [Vibrio genomosp. F10]|uniref:aspartate kinase n=1 Tax=Vibrio genomosp. F10 TaxID=723171 RepID=UPI000311E7E8|nr:aspartate kinase [Vibrio genomosp. F10]OEF08741.1 aspartate kinase [Vibrio genomosp. F10 str. 9ZD137]
MNKPVIVQKFGGTSVGTIESIRTVAEHIINAKQAGNHVAVVVSAMSGETNRLVSLAKQVDSVPNARELDVLLSSGEQVSMALLAMTLNKLGHKACSLTAAQASIYTNSQHNDATITRIDTKRIDDLFADGNIVIVAGFQGITANGDITTLGRGGSDTTAVTLAGSLKAQECQIYTDVDGVYTCDPRVIPDAKKLEVIDFPSMEIMARKGAKVLHLPSVQYARENNVPLRVLSTFEHNQGSLIEGEKVQRDVTGLAICRDMLLVEVEECQLASAKTHCQMLGITVCNVIKRADYVGIVIEHGSISKLDLVFGEKIRNSSQVSLLTVVGLQAKGIIKSSKQLLMERDIAVVDCSSESLSLTFVLSQECIDDAAHVLHDAYIAQSQVFDSHQRQVFLG